jgi:hypothetical protein
MRTYACGVDGYRATKDRPHFYLVYGTKSARGLEAFRDTEYDAAKVHARDRADAKDRKEVEDTRQTTFFTGLNADTQEAAVADSVEANKRAASETVVAELTKVGGQMRFDKLWPLILDAYALRVTNVKDICKQLAKDGVLENTWGGGNHKPQDETIITLKAKQ